MRIARVFPRRTAATPDGPLAFIDAPGLYPPEVDEVHVSVAFTWDIPKAERLAKAWEHIAPVKVGGPAFGNPSGEFEPGRYLKPGYVITSRGCPNACWFCSVWRREGRSVRELPIRDGWNVLDDNLLACSDSHVKAVFAMLRKQTARPRFTGGLEAARLKPWHVEELRALKPKSVFFAYDTPEDLEPLHAAAELLKRQEWPMQARTAGTYVLIGYRNDSPEAAERRLREVMALGLYPMAMLWRDETGKVQDGWARFQRAWARPALIYARERNERMER